MPPPLRPIDDGLVYDVINRGNNRQPRVRTPADFQAFLAALDAVDRPAVQHIHPHRGLEMREVGFYFPTPSVEGRQFLAWLTRANLGSYALS